MSIEVKMPQVTQTMSEATIIRWMKSEGDSVNAGEPLLEIMSDKAAVEVESPASGILGRVLVKEGDVSVGTPIAIIVASGEAIPEQSLGTGEQKAPVATAAVQVSASPQGNGQPATSRKRVSPLARRLASELGVNLEKVTATGPGGLITEADVRRAVDKPQAPAPAGPSSGAQAPQVQVARQVPPDAADARGVEPPIKEWEEILPLQGVRKIIAERMSLSRHTAADVTTVAEVDMGEIAALREHIDLTYTAFIARAVVVALTEFPMMNSRLQGDKIVISKKIHLGVAVAIDEGLKVPVIREAQGKSLRQIGLELADLSKRGAEGKLAPEELVGSTFTVTNSGVFGSLLFTPIINPPEAGILGMGKIVKTPVVRDDQIVIRPVMYLCLTYDHRIVDGAPAVKFLQRVKALLEKPVWLL